MKMHYTISPIGSVTIANGVSRLNGFAPSTDRTTTPAHFGACPQPFGRSRRF